MNILELKKQREKLWSELDAVLAEMEPFKVKERKIREQLKIVQDKSYLLEMEPKLADIATKALTDPEQEKKFNQVNDQCKFIKEKYKL